MALFDELEKIATVQKNTQDVRKESIKRALKNALLVSAGGGIGTGIFTGVIKPAIDSLSPEAKRRLALPAAMLTMAGASVVAAKIKAEREKRERLE